jgi:two-component system, response regulator
MEIKYTFWDCLQQKTAPATRFFMNADILLVEDSHEDAALAIRVLKQDNPGTKIKLVYDGSEALDWLFGETDANRNKKLPKVIFLDVKLPRITGPEVLQKIKADDSVSQIPVVIMTSSNQQIDIAECYRLGANSYLVKPIDFLTYSQMILTASRYWLNYNITCPA